MGEVDGEGKTEKLDAERRARRRAALTHVRQHPDPVLRMRARDVGEFDEALAHLVERMATVMREASGVGLAAPQLGILRRVLVYQTSEDEPLVALVNPRLVDASEERSAEEEGCLSLGGASVVVEVERAARVTVEGLSPEREPRRVDAEGLEARVLQHELDHLDGVLIIDRTSPEQRRAALAELRRQPVLA